MGRNHHFKALVFEVVENQMNVNIKGNAEPWIEVTDMKLKIIVILLSLEIIYTNFYKFYSLTLFYKCKIDTVYYIFLRYPECVGYLLDWLL